MLDKRFTTEAIMIAKQTELTQEEMQSLGQTPIDYLGEDKHIYNKSSLDEEVLKDVLSLMQDDDAEYLLIDWS